MVDLFRPVGDAELLKIYSVGVVGIGGQYLRSGIHISLMDRRHSGGCGKAEIIVRGVDEKVPPVKFRPETAVKNQNIL